MPDGGTMKLKAEIRVDYLHLRCTDCDGMVELANVRRDGAVPMVDVKCSKCGTQEVGIKLMPNIAALVG